MRTAHSYQHLIGRRVDVAAFAKVNLRLKIVGRRADGYHLLSMLNNEISLCDHLGIAFEEEPGVRVDCEGENSDPDFSDVGKNLAARAASAYMRAAGIPIGIRIFLRKEIPVGAGLGGGSSDAAAVLRLLQREVALPSMNGAVLLTLASTLGADVSYFLVRGLCRIGGVGESVDRISGSPLHGREIFLFVPKDPIATLALYSFYRQKFPDLPSCPDGPLQAALDQGSLPYEKILALVENDFETVLPEFAPRLWTEILAVREVPGLCVGLTGSGSSYFALTDERVGGSANTLAELQKLLSSRGTKVLPLRFVCADE